MRSSNEWAGTPRAPRSSKAWCAYFRTNARGLFRLPWNQGAQVTRTEKDLLAASLQDFQVGESSEGHNLLRLARSYAERADDPHYPEAMQLFIREEQRHAGDLGTFLRMAGIPVLEHTWLNVVFRWFRRAAGL